MQGLVSNLIVNSIKEKRRSRIKIRTRFITNLENRKKFSLCLDMEGSKVKIRLCLALKIDLSKFIEVKIIENIKETTRQITQKDLKHLNLSSTHSNNLSIVN
jgi:hypothetical protein